jgi:hypothetical protein
VTSDQHCPVPGCGRRVVVYARSTGAYPELSTLVARSSAGFRMRSCAVHEQEFMDGLGDALDWAIVTRTGPQRTVIVGKKVRT